MAKTVVAYVVVDRPDGFFAVVRTGGDLPEQSIMIFRSRKHAQKLADELNHAYMAGWHDCLIEQIARKREEGGGGNETKRRKRG